MSKHVNREKQDDIPEKQVDEDASNEVSEKLDEEELDLTSRTYKAIVEHGMEGILQSQLWKELSLTSRDGSRLAIRLEKRAMIRRERVLENGRWTYRLFPIRMPIKTTSIRDTPCLTCKVVEQCSNNGKISSKTCDMLKDWVRKELATHKVVMNVEAQSG